MSADDTLTLWLCTCCTLWLANRDHSGCDDASCEPLSALAEDDLTLGFGWDEHYAECLTRTEPDHNGGECTAECELITFTWSPCDGCHSHSGGQRHAATLWERTAHTATTEQEHTS